MALTAHDFTLEVVSSDEDNIRYRIGGSITCDREGYSFKLKPGNEGINPTDERAVLVLHVDEPEAGAEVINEKEVAYEGSDSSKLQVVDIGLGSVRTSKGHDSIQLQVS